MGGHGSPGLGPGPGRCASACPLRQPFISGVEPLLHLVERGLALTTPSHVATPGDARPLCNTILPWTEARAEEFWVPAAPIRAPAAPRDL